MSKKLNSLSIIILLITSGCIATIKKQINEQEENQNAKSPNFIFILADDQGWNGTSLQMMNNDPLSKSDYHQTPNLEVLASKGMKFSNAYAAAPVCAPSRYGIQFGQTPARLSLIRVGMNTNHIDHEKTKSIPKALKEINSEYRTAHFGKWGMGSNPSTFGYDESDGPTKNKDGGFVNNKEQWGNTISDDPKKIFSLTNKAIDFIKKNVKEERPFYIQISHYAVHASLQMRQKSLDKYEQKTKGKYQKNPGFAAMTEDLDEGLGLLLNNIENLNIGDNTYIIYMSDNGSVPNIPGAKKYQSSYNFPLSRGKWDAMEGGLRVPLVISGPGIKNGAENGTPVSGIDLLPTIIDLANGKGIILKQIDGGSFKNILVNNENHKINRPVNGLYFHVPYVNKIALARAHSAIRQGDFKLIKFQDNNELQLFNLHNDKSESLNLFDSLNNKAKSMEKMLDNYLINVHAPKWKEGITWKNKPIEEFKSSY